MMVTGILLKESFANVVMSTPYFSERVEASYLRDLCMS